MMGRVNLSLIGGVLGLLLILPGVLADTEMDSAVARDPVLSGGHGIFPPSPPLTQLLVTLEIIGPHTQNKDAFDAVMHVRNVGPVPAIHVRGALLGLPEGWRMSPHGITQFGDIGVGEEKQALIHVTRTEVDGTLYYIAAGDNAYRSSSEHVNVPISPLVLAGVAFSMVGLFAFSRKQKKDGLAGRGH